MNDLKKQFKKETGLEAEYTGKFPAKLIDENTAIADVDVWNCAYVYWLERKVRQINEVKTEIISGGNGYRVAFTIGVQKFKTVSFKTKERAEVYKLNLKNAFNNYPEIPDSSNKQNLSK